MRASDGDDGNVVGVNGLCKAYQGVEAVRDVSFEVRRGEIFGILGPNGAGKTTIVECVQGLRRIDSGQVRVLGLNPETEAKALRKRMGSQLQSSGLPDRIRVWEVLDLFSRFHPTGRPVDALLDEWGLTDERKSSFESLSGGQQQRLFVALALLGDPEVVFLDEMTQGLDPASRRMAWDLIRAIRDRGTTVVLVTHYMEEATRLCDRVAIIAHGTVVDIDSPQNLINRHHRAIHITFTTDVADLGWLAQVAGVTSVAREGPRVEVVGSGAVLVRTAAALVEHDIVPVDLQAEQPSLEDVFLDLVSGAEAAGSPS